MKAIGYTNAGPISAEDALIELEVHVPQPGPKDLLVEVRGISVNPVDVKVRTNMQPDGPHRILGFDAAGIVKEVGTEVTRFSPGDEVFYAGDFTRSGTNAERQLVDERIVGRKPSSLGEEMQALGVSPRYVAALTNTDQHFAAITELIEPRGHIAVIDDPKSLDVLPLKFKAISLSWEFMFTRPMFQTEDMDVQHLLLNRVADLLDDGTLLSTVNRHGGTMSVENLRSAHELQESGTAIGKTVLDGFSAS